MTNSSIPEDRHVNPKLGDLCVKLCERADALGYKGKRADGFALDSFIAATIGAELAGDADLAQFLSLMSTMVICVRGMSEVRMIAERRRAELAG